MGICEFCGNDMVESQYCVAENSKSWTVISACVNPECDNKGIRVEVLKAMIEKRLDQNIQKNKSQKPKLVLSGKQSGGNSKIKLSAIVTYEKIGDWR